MRLLLAAWETGHEIHILLKWNHKWGTRRKRLRRELTVMIISMMIYLKKARLWLGWISGIVIPHPPLDRVPLFLYQNTHIKLTQLLRQTDRQSVLSVCITIGERWSLVPLIHPVHHNIPAKIHKSNHKTPGRLSGSDWTDIIWLCQMVSSSQCPLLLWSTSALFLTCPIRDSTLGRLSRRSLARWTLKFVWSPWEGGRVGGSGEQSHSSVILCFVDCWFIFRGLCHRRRPLAWSGSWRFFFNFYISCIIFPTYYLLIVFS